MNGNSFGRTNGVPLEVPFRHRGIRLAETPAHLAAATRLRPLEPMCGPGIVRRKDRLAQPVGDRQSASAEALWIRFDVPRC